MSVENAEKESQSKEEEKPEERKKSPKKKEKKPKREGGFQIWNELENQRNKFMVTRLLEIVSAFILLHHFKVTLPC